MRDPRDELHDPNTTPERLYEITQSYPELGAIVANHPNAYPELREWIANYAPAPQHGPGQHGPGQPGPAMQTGSAHPTGAGSAPSQYAESDSNGAAGIRSRKRRMLALSLCIVLVLVLGTGGGVWWYISSKIDGSGTPEGAATKLVNSVADLDRLSLYGSLAPSEFDLLKSSFEDAESSEPHGSNESIGDRLNDIQDVLDVDVSDLDTKTTKIADGVQRVTFTGGNVSVDGDAAEIADMVTDVGEDVLGEEIGSDEHNYLKEDIDENLPVSTSVQDLADEAGAASINVVSVKEDGRWYVSPLMTVTDSVYTAESAYNDDLPDLGRTVVDPAASSDPSGAAKSLSAAVANGDLEQIAENLPLAERRVLSVYGPWLMNDAGNMWQDSEINLNNPKFTAESSGSLAHIDIDHLDITWSQWNDTVDSDLSRRVIIQGSCFKSEFEKVEQDDYWDDDYWDDDYWDDDDDDYYDESPDVYEDTSDGCLGDLPLSKELGFDKIAITAVEEDGGWLVSPVATVSDTVSTVIDRVTTLAEDGKLEDLIEEAVRSSAEIP